MRSWLSFLTKPTPPADGVSRWLGNMEAAMGTGRGKPARLLLLFMEFAPTRAGAGPR